MAGGVARAGDLLGPGGVIIGRFASSVTVNGRNVICQPSVYGPHLGCSPKKPQHCFGPIIDVPGGVTVEGLPPLTQGGKGICGHGVKTASKDVLIVSGGLGILGSVLGLALGGLNFGESDIGGFASAFEQTAAPITTTISGVENAIKGIIR